MGETAERRRQWLDLCERWNKHGLSALSSTERTWATVRSLIDLTNNGGLIAYFYNSGADDYEEMMASLDRLGMPRVKTQVLRVAALFPDGISTNAEDRNDVIGSWPEEDPTIDQLMDEVDRALYGLFKDLEARIEEFLTQEGF